MDDGYRSKQGIDEKDVLDIPEETKKKLIRLMARIMERAYRRGVQQSLYLSSKNAIDEWILNSLHDYRYEKSLDISIGLDGFTTTSIKRLFIEESLYDIGFFEED